MLSSQILVRRGVRLDAAAWGEGQRRGVCCEREVAGVSRLALALLLCRWHECRAVVMGAACLTRAVLY